MKSKYTIQEKLGVPDGLPEAAREIWEKYLERLFKKINFRKALSGLDHTSIEFDHPLKVGNIFIRRMIFAINCNTISNSDFNSISQNAKRFSNSNGDVILSGMANRRMPSGFNFNQKTKNFTISKSNPDYEQFMLEFTFAVNEKVLQYPNESQYFEDSVREIIFSNIPKIKTEIISSISHELSHHYAHSMTSNRNIRNQSRQKLIDKFNSFPIVNRLFYSLYKTDDDEMHVYSSEFKSMLDSDKVTKSEFKKYLLNSKLYKEFKEIENYTYNDFISTLGSYIVEITQILKAHHPDPSVRNNVSSMTTQKKINLFLSHTYDLYAESLADIHVKGILTQMRRSQNTNIRVPNIDIINDVRKIVNSIQNKVKGRKNAYVYFWKSLVKLSNMRARNVIRKISKLYDTLPSDKDDSVKEISESHMIYKNFFKTY